MKIPNLRKYFFLNVAAILSIFFWNSIYAFRTANIPPVYGWEDPIITPGLEYRAAIFLWGILLLASLGLAVVEILIRHFVIKKYFHFRINLTLTLPKIIDILYSFVFYIGLFCAVLPAVLLGYFLIVMQLEFLFS